MPGKTQYRFIAVSAAVVVALALAPPVLAADIYVDAGAGSAEGMSVSVSLEET